MFHFVKHKISTHRLLITSLHVPEIQLVHSQILSTLQINSLETSDS